MANTKTATDAKPMSKTEIVNALVERTGMSKKDVNNFFEQLTDLIRKNLTAKKGPQVFNLPGLMKIYVVHKPATKERKGINRFTGQEQIFKAKPARNVVKVRPLKQLKDMV
jgi:nucleoid DNA-binding protein